jgi:hypothetical protein
MTKKLKVLQICCYIIKLEFIKQYLKFSFLKMPFSIIDVMLLKVLPSFYIILFEIIVCKNNEGIAFCKLYLL